MFVWLASGMKCTDMCKLSTRDKRWVSGDSDDSSTEDEYDDDEDND